MTLTDSAIDYDKMNNKIEESKDNSEENMRRVVTLYNRVGDKCNVVVDDHRNSLLTEFGKATLTDRYLQNGETFQDLFVRVAVFYSDNNEHAQRLYDYISKLYFMPATPILSNGGTERGLPISCFLNETEDSLQGIVDLWNENVWLAARGGGIGSYWGNLRSIGEKVKGSGGTSGIIPFIVVQDALTLAISQGSLRRGSSAVYLPVWHPEIEEFLDIRKPTGGDHNRKAMNINHAVVVTDKFMEAVEQGADWDLTSPHTGKTLKTIKARDLWIKILIARIETGEPYILFIDKVNENLPEVYKRLGLEVKMSNLCSEITLATGKDHRGENRTAVCCLSSINIEKHDEWIKISNFIEDIMRFLDNVLEDFVHKAPAEMKKAVYAVMRERSVGIGTMGFHSFLQSKMIPFESAMAKSWNIKIFKHIKEQADQASRTLAIEKAPCLDAEEAGLLERFANKIAIAPTASISIIAGGASPGIEPFAANFYMQKTLTGSFAYKNKYLETLLEVKGKNDQETWESIAANSGSVKHLDFLDEYEKDIFSTAYELNQHYIIEHAADRTPYVCQAQSVNLFLPADVDKQYLHDVHYQAWKKGLKSLYYMRSQTVQRGDKVSEVRKHEIGEDENAVVEEEARKKYVPIANDECLSCQ